MYPDRRQQHLHDQLLIEQWYEEIDIWCRAFDYGPIPPKLPYLTKQWRSMLRAVMVVALRLRAGEPATVQELVDDIYDLGMGHPQIEDGVRGWLGALQALSSGVNHPDIAIPLDEKHDRKCRWVLLSTDWHGDLTYPVVTTRGILTRL